MIPKFLLFRVSSDVAKRTWDIKGKQELKTDIGVQNSAYNSVGFSLHVLFRPLMSWWYCVVVVAWKQSVKMLGNKTLRQLGYPLLRGCVSPFGRPKVLGLHLCSAKCWPTWDCAHGWCSYGSLSSCLFLSVKACCVIKQLAMSSILFSFANDRWWLSPCWFNGVSKQSSHDSKCSLMPLKSCWLQVVISL